MVNNNNQISNYISLSPTTLRIDNGEQQQPNLQLQLHLLITHDPLIRPSPPPQFLSAGATAMKNKQWAVPTATVLSAGATAMKNNDYHTQSGQLLRIAMLLVLIREWTFRRSDARTSTAPKQRGNKIKLNKISLQGRGRRDGRYGLLQRHLLRRTGPIAQLQARK
ncbi:unnamed protein product [Caenorhabditis auriculariae]|uniref:Uncharacterized protein n=1 Tax=Caenorhabditis auriculariae TaxID=2777116 RepID=A0A8S1HFB2_9PELO|nr:unnamed protein product [Caenorhabditis auriculariae]